MGAGGLYVVRVRRGSPVDTHPDQAQAAFSLTPTPPRRTIAAAGNEVALRDLAHRDLVAPL